MMGLDMHLELTVHIVQLGSSGIHDLQDAGLGVAVRDAQALASGHQHRCQLPATHDHGGQFTLLLVGQRGSWP